MHQDIVKNNSLFTFRDLRYWAQDGMVYIVDERDGEI